jgi:uncharacterized protein YndB with AHSA1/START domain
MTFQASRKIAAPPSSVFAAFEDSSRLAVWWGPAGFTNTLVPANEQLLDRLSAEVLRKHGGG